MSGKIVYLLCILFCLGACSDDRFSDSDPAVSPSLGEAVPVNLALDVAPLLSPLSGTTRTGAGGSGLQASFSGMEVELSGTPVVSTRQFPNVVVVDDSKINSVVILQFDGVSPESKSVQIDFRTAQGDVVDLSGIKLRSSATVTRIAVIANLNESDLKKEDWSEGGNKTYKNLLNSHIDIYDPDSEGQLLPDYPLYKDQVLMFGMVDTKIEANKQVTVILQRILAKATFKIEIAQKLKDDYNIWQAELSGMPKSCYLVPLGRGKPFPTPESLGDDGYYNNSAVNAVNGVFDPDALSAYMPVNLQPEVEVATAQTRTLLAPQGSTYLQITGLKTSPSGSVIKNIQYKVHLGSNFTTDYSISPNTFYNYTINVKDDNPQDGTIVKFVPGYWGGKLKGYKEDGTAVDLGSDDAVTWRYEKQIEVYPTDVLPPSGQKKKPWGPIGGGSLSPTSLDDGWQNTWDIHSTSSGAAPRQDYPASYACYNLNVNVGSKEDLLWYQPGIAQLLGTYLVAFNLLSTLSDTYWSSTAVDVDNAYFITKRGGIAPGTKSASLAVRAVRDLEPANK